ncbi:uncharacterized protein LOC131890523 [Tigriopus californicus]|nr:uncharacterized protein LOC131890523 [Tigriopus californicus]
MSCIEVPNMSELSSLVRMVTEALGASLIVYFVYGKFTHKTTKRPNIKKNAIPTKTVGVMCEMRSITDAPSDPEIVPKLMKDQAVQVVEDSQHEQQQFKQAAQEDREIEEKAIQDFFQLSAKGIENSESMAENTPTTTDDSTQTDSEPSLIQSQCDLDHFRDLVRTLEVQLKQYKLDIIKEKSKSELIRHEMRSQGEILELKMNQAQEDRNEALVDLQRMQNESLVHRDTFQTTLRALKAGLDEKDNQVQELEDSNAMLRKDLVDLMTQFQSEKSKMEKKLVQYLDKIDDLNESNGGKNQIIARLEHEIDENKAHVEKRRKEKKKLIKENQALRTELEQIYRDHQRNKKMSRIMRHIENID